MAFRGVYHDAYADLKNNQSLDFIAHLYPLIKHVTFNNSEFNSENLTLEIKEISKSDEHESAINVEIGKICTVPNLIVANAKKEKQTS